MRLSTGDVVIAAKGDSHFLSSAPGMRGEPDIAVYRRPVGHALPLPHVLNETAGGPESCHFVCGYLGCDMRPFNPLIEGLPSFCRPCFNREPRVVVQSPPHRRR
jgi:hypothetical protein